MIDPKDYPAAESTLAQMRDKAEKDAIAEIQSFTLNTKDHPQLVYAKYATLMKYRSALENTHWHAGDKALSKPE